MKKIITAIMLAAAFSAAADDLKLADTIIINPMSADSSDQQLEFMHLKEIQKWAKSYGLKVAEDSVPVLDNVAFFTPAYSAVFTVEGYDRNLNYRLIIDFVRYSGKMAPLNSLLKIWGRDSSGKMFLISVVNQGCMTGNKLFETLIPYDLSYQGKFDIIIREYSDKPGKWGIWDIIVTSKRAEEVEILKPDASEKMKETEQKIFK